MNYRLGALGWLAGSKFQEDGDANAGLLDQRFALHWVKKYISRFGGNPKDVTLIGESAGGASIMHQITAYGGSSDGDGLFQKAIIQSPGFFPQEDDDDRKKTLSRFLELLDVSSIEEARNRSFADVFAANAKQVYESPYGQFTYGPAVDGKFVPDLASNLFADGRFNHDVVVMVGHNADEVHKRTPFFRPSPHLSNGK